MDESDESGVNLAMLRLDALVEEEKEVPEKATKKRKKLLINQCLLCPGIGGF